MGHYNMKAIGIGLIGCVTSGMAAPPAASAQVAGDRVRVTLPSGQVVGVLTEARSAELVLERWGGGSQTVARGDIRRLERSLGEHSLIRERAIIGAMGGWVSSIICAICAYGSTEIEMAGLMSGVVLAGAGVRCADWHVQYGRVVGDDRWLEFAGCG